MTENEYRQLRKVDWTPHVLKHLKHLFRPVTKAETKMCWCCGEYPGGDTSGGCGKPLLEGSLIDRYYLHNADHFTPPFCMDCEAAYVKENIESEWEWRTFNTGTWEAILAGYVDPYTVEPIKDSSDCFGHRLVTGVERACYFDDMVRLLRENLPITIEGVSTVREWEHSDWLKERTEVEIYLTTLAKAPSTEEKEWARFWWDVIEEAGIDLKDPKKHHYLRALLLHVGQKRTRFELMFEDF